MVKLVKFSNDFILKYLKDYYIQHRDIPKYAEKQHPFSSRTVGNRFGSWGNALKLAGVPLRINDPQEVVCTQCSKTFTKLYNQIKRGPHHFCSCRCSAIYNNKHRKTGTRISKLELYLQSNLEGYKFDYNNRSVCDGLELDIYIEELKLAFEINGITHYKPIYGIEKLEKTQSKDLSKNKLCDNMGIILHTIKDESLCFSEEYGELILERIYRMIHQHTFNDVLKSI